MAKVKKWKAESMTEDASVHRFMKLSMFMALIRDSEFTFTHAGSQLDTFEDMIHDFMITRLIAGKLDETFLGNEPHNVFGSYWTLEDESSAISQVYGRVKDCNPVNDDTKLWVQVRTPICRLVDELAPIDIDGNLCIARVEYLHSGSVHQRGANLIHRKGNAAKTDPESYMLKRCQFKWEREIRLLFVPDDPDVAIDTRPPLKLDWSAVVNQVVLDPRCVTSRPGQLERELTAPGFTCTVEESDLSRRILVQLRLPDSPKESGLVHATERHREPERVHP